MFVEFHLDTLNDFIKKVVDKARKEGREEIIQLLKDKKLLGDWLKKHPRKEVLV